jgi:alanine racemase
MRSWLEVSLKRIRSNFAAVRGIVNSGIEVMPVVKADAYGHGALEVARVLEEDGAKWLAVSNAEEGVALRRAGMHARVLVMADFLPESRPMLEEYGLTPVVHCLEDLAGVKVPYHLKIDSGMGRLGTRCEPEEIAKAVSKCKEPLEGVMTHFASSANFDSRQTEEQIEHFERVLDALRASGHAPRYVHASSTNSIAYERRNAWGNLVRPGHAIYGYISAAKGAPKAKLEVAPALSWKATVLAMNNVPAGARIGYGGIHTAERPMRIAVLAAGYADGIPHRLGNRGQVIVNGKFAPIVGAVSMDLTTIDVTDCPEVKVGDAVMLLGEEGGISINAQQMARMAGTISYSVLCGINPRVKRVYVD